MKRLSYVLLSADAGGGQGSVSGGNSRPSDLLAMEEEIFGQIADPHRQDKLPQVAMLVQMGWKSMETKSTIDVIYRHSDGRAVAVREDGSFGLIAGESSRSNALSAMEDELFGQIADPHRHNKLPQNAMLMQMGWKSIEAKPIIDVVYRHSEGRSVVVRQDGSFSLVKD